jgi:tRNA pseudouridine38-40 synthase
MQSYKLLLALAYNGRRFLGNQLQPGEQRTVQLALLAALNQLGLNPSNGKFAGRTDAGTHAVWQLYQTWVTGNACEQPLRYPINSLAKRLNALLPQDITVWAAHLVKNDAFDVRQSAIYRWYRYRVQFSEQDDCWRPDTTCHLRLSAPQGHLLNACANDLLGYHNFKAFQHTDTPVQNTHCTIYGARWQKVPTPSAPETWQFDIIGNRFLYKMVRNLVAEHLSVAVDQQPIGLWRQRLAEAPVRQSGQRTAPSHGLTLMCVYYLPCFRYFDKHTVVLQLEQELNALEFMDENLFCQAAGN